MLPIRTPLSITVGTVALVAPSLHTVSDLMEWYQRGFSSPQLWVNYLAFLPMPWLLLGVYVLHDPRPGAIGLVGAILYGAAFTFFAHTTLFALAEHTPNYAALWGRLGGIYTFHGGLMVCGGLLFAWPVLRAGWLPRWSVLLFMAGILTNLVLGLLRTPEILQTIGSTARNLGLIAMGHTILLARPRPGAEPIAAADPAGTPTFPAT